MLEVRNLEVVYNDVILVLRGVSFSVPDGNIVALLGANGAGKTTVLRAISGLLGVHNGEVTKGEVTLNDERIDNADAASIVKRGVVQVLEGRRIFAELSVDDNLRAGGYTNEHRESSDQAYERVMTLFPILGRRAKSTAGYLSGGEQQMLAIGRALMSDPSGCSCISATGRGDCHRGCCGHIEMLFERLAKVVQFEDGHLLESLDEVIS